MNNLDKQYQYLLADIMANGVKKEDRTGTGTISVFGRQIRHKMSEGFPLITTKKMYFKGIVTELLWFLRGETDIRYLWKHNCHIWDGDWYKAYSKSCSSPYSLNEMIQFGLEWDENPRHFDKSIWDLGPIYGKQWKKWNCLDSGFFNLEDGEEVEIDSQHIDISHEIDQIENLIDDLKTNPDSRRLMVTAWNPAELSQMVLPPCHYGFQLYTRELTLEEKLNLVKKRFPNVVSTDGWTDLYQDTGSAEEWLKSYGIEQIIPSRAISLMWNQRSVDTFLGLPFNIASYGLLLEIIAKEVNMVPDELIGNLGDTHLYLNHIDQANIQLTRGHYALPTLNFNKSSFTEYLPTDFVLDNYESHPTIKAALSN